MDLIKKLEDLSVRFQEVSKEVADPDLVKDQKKYKDVMRENQYLSDLMALYDEYKKVLNRKKFNFSKEILENKNLIFPFYKKYYEINN